MFTRLFATIGFLCFALSLPAVAEDVHFQDFEDTTDLLTEWSDTSTLTTPVGSRRFLGDFGMVRIGRTDGTLYMRGSGGGSLLHVSERGEAPGLIGVAFLAAEAASTEAPLIYRDEPRLLLPDIPGARGAPPIYIMKCSILG